MIIQLLHCTTMWSLSTTRNSSSGSDGGLRALGSSWLIVTPCCSLWARLSSFNVRRRLMNYTRVSAGLPPFIPGNPSRQVLVQLSYISEADHLTCRGLWCCAPYIIRLHQRAYRYSTAAVRSQCTDRLLLVWLSSSSLVRLCWFNVWVSWSRMTTIHSDNVLESVRHLP